MSLSGLERRKLDAVELEVSFVRQEVECRHENSIFKLPSVQLEQKL
jgi:hypothetical protein